MAGCNCTGACRIYGSCSGMPAFYPIAYPMMRFTMSTDMTREEGVAMHAAAEQRRLDAAIDAACVRAGDNLIFNRVDLRALIAAERALERECVATEAEINAMIEEDERASR